MRGPLLLPALLLLGFAAAVALRCAIGGPGVARSWPAGLVFAAVLLVLALAATPAHLRVWRAASVGGALTTTALGIAGAVVLCVPALVSAAGTGTLAMRPHTGFLGWALVVTVVAAAEETFLRGTLYRLLEPYGAMLAVGVPAVAFALLHVPLYGWGAAPLDLAVGVWLGALRAVAGTWTAPAVAHVLADWAAWKLV